MTRTFVVALAALVALFTCLAGCAPAPSAARPPSSSSNEIVIHVKPMAVGMVAVSTSTLQRETLVQVGDLPRKVEMTYKKLTTTRDEILAMVDGHRTRSRITFVQHEVHEGPRGHIEVTPSRVAGKTYVVERRGADVIVTGADGAAVADEERAAVLEELPNFGKGARFGEGIPSGPIRVGERVDSMEKVMAAELAEGERGPDASDVSITLEEIRDVDGVPCAVFRLHVTFGGKTDDHATAKATMSGTMVIRSTDGWTVEETGWGPISFRGETTIDGRPTPISASGTLRMTTKRRRE
jgi:hypothetical protein